MIENQKISKETKVTVERGDYRMVCVGDDDGLSVVRVERVGHEGSGTGGVIASSLSAFDLIMLGELGREALSAIRGWRSELSYAALGCKEHGVVLAAEKKCPVCSAAEVPPTLPAPEVEQVPTPPADKPDYSVPL